MSSPDSSSAHPDHHALQGIWRPRKSELAGEAAPEIVHAQLELELTDRHYIVRFGGEISDRGTYTIDATREPKQIILTGTKGTNAGRTMPSIYQLAGSHLRICYALEGEAHPTEFKTTTGVRHYLALYHRQ